MEVPAAEVTGSLVMSLLTEAAVGGALMCSGLNSGQRTGIIAHIYAAVQTHGPQTEQGQKH